MRRSLAFIPLCVAAACSASGGNSTVNGTIGGHGISPAWAVLIPTPTELNINILTQDACSTGSANGPVLNLWVYTFTASGLQPPTAPGRYDVMPSATMGTVAGAGFVPDYPNTSSLVGATAGTVTITSIAQREVKGSFDLTFQDGSHVTGSFDANGCWFFYGLDCGVPEVGLHG